MFGFLKKKLKEAVETITKKTDEEADVVEETVEEKTVEKPVEKPEKKKKQEKKKEQKKEEKPKEKIAKPDVIKEEKKQPGKKEAAAQEKAEPVEKGYQEETKKPEEKRGFLQRVFQRKETEQHEIKDKEEIVEEEPAEDKEEKPVVVEKLEETEQAEAEEEKPKSILQKISETVTKVSLSEKKFEEIFWELELILLENNVAVEVIEKIKSDLKKELVENKISRKEIEEKIVHTLKESISGLFDVEQIDILKESKKKKPYVIMFVGVNGAGKTTSLAKFINLLKKNSRSCVVGACDTFRAAAIQQLQEHTDKLGVKLIKHDYGADPAAVAFDTIQHAKAKDIDIVLLDTAGRLHSNKNLMQELQKITKVSEPNLRIFVGESLAGNDVVEQVKLFNEKIGIDGIILSKADTDEKGGAAISVSYVTGKPILYLGVGQNYDDLEKFEKKTFIEKLGLT